MGNKMNKNLSPVYSLKLKKYYFVFNSRLNFCFSFFYIGHIHNIVSTLTNVVKIDVENDVFLTLSDVVQINVEKDNVGSNVVQHCKLQR